jgi:flagellar biosynthesis GTPase FlhF
MIRNIKQYLKAISGKIQNVINNQESASNYLVVVVGDTGVGKTTALRKFTQRPFPNHVVPTVAV